MKEKNIVGPRKGSLFLFGISFLSLFLELLLIRWIGVELRIFAYFRNLTLISCFLGLGIGFNLKRFRVGLLFSLFLILILAVAIHPGVALHGVSLRQIQDYLSFPEYNIWYTPDQTALLKMVAGYTLLASVVILLAGVFVPFGQILGDIFAVSENRIRDYSINLLGSLCGTWAFSLLSYRDAPPWIWFLICAGCMTILIRPWPRGTIIGVGAVMAILFLTQERDAPGYKTFWSPYQKLQLWEVINKEYGVPYFILNINSILNRATNT